MYRFVLLALCACAAQPVYGYSAYLNTSTEPFSQYILENSVEIERVYHGLLENSPDTYEFVADESFTLVLSIRIPDISAPRTDMSGIVVRKRQRGGVEEVARLRASEASWEPVSDPVSGLRYLEGPTFEAPLSPGTYRVEVSTPDNQGWYALTVGFRDADVGYFTQLGMVREVRAFYGLGVLGLVRSPLVYQPVGIVVLPGLLYLTWRWHQLRRRASIIPLD